jgi:hypothetical protein
MCWLDYGLLYSVLDEISFVVGTSVCRYVRVAKMDGTAFSFAELRLYKSENVVTI